MLSNIDEIDKVDQFEPLNNLLVDVTTKEDEKHQKEAEKKLEEKLKKEKTSEKKLDEKVKKEKKK